MQLLRGLRPAPLAGVALALALTACGSHASAPAPEKQAAAAAQTCPSAFTTGEPWVTQAWKPVDFDPGSEAWVCSYRLGIEDDERAPRWERHRAPAVLDRDGMALAERLVDSLAPLDADGPCTADLGPTLTLTQGDHTSGFTAVIEHYGCRLTSVVGRPGAHSADSSDVDALLRHVWPAEYAPAPAPHP